MGQQPSPEGKVRALAQDLVKTIRSGNIELPMLPTAALSVFRASQAPDPNLAAIASIIEQDQSLTGEVLRVANSPAFWPRTKITSVIQAATRLGLRRLTRVTFTAALSASMFNGGGAFQAHMNRYRNVSLATALWNRKLTALRSGDTESAFLNGLMRNVGRPAALRLVAARSKGFTKEITETDLTGLVRVLHRPLGALLATQWALPPATRACVEFHGRLLPKNYGDEVAASYCASLLAKATVYPEEATLEAIADNPIVAYLRLSATDIESIHAEQSQVRERIFPP